MRQVFKLAIEEVVIGCRGSLQKGMRILVERTGGKDTQTSCFGAVSYMITKAHSIYGRMRPKLRRGKHKRLLISSIKTEAACKAGWEALTALRRVNINRLGKLLGPQPQWRFNKANGFLSRDTKGGIDWWRYRKEIFQS